MVPRVLIYTIQDLVIDLKADCSNISVVKIPTRHCMKMTKSKRMRCRLYFPNPLPVRSLPNLHSMVHAGKEGDKFSPQPHSKGQDEIKVDRTEEENEDQDDKTTLVSQRLFFWTRVLPGWYRFFSFVGDNKSKNIKSARVNKSQRRHPSL